MLLGGRCWGGLEGLGQTEKEKMSEIERRDRPRPGGTRVPSLWSHACTLPEPCRNHTVVLSPNASPENPGVPTTAPQDLSAHWQGDLRRRAGSAHWGRRNPMGQPGLGLTLAWPLASCVALGKLSVPSLSFPIFQVWGEPSSYAAVMPSAQLHHGYPPQGLACRPPAQPVKAAGLGIPAPAPKPPPACSAWCPHGS